jgi:hypothetical protein
MDANVPRPETGDAQSTPLQALDQVSRRRAQADERQLRLVGGFGAVIGAVVSTGAFIGGFAPALVILLSVLPGALVAYAVARYSRRRSRALYQEELKLLGEHRVDSAHRASPSPRVADILNGMFAATKADPR